MAALRPRGDHPLSALVSKCSPRCLLETGEQGIAAILLPCECKFVMHSQAQKFMPGLCKIAIPHCRTAGGTPFD